MTTKGVNRDIVVSLITIVVSFLIYPWVEAHPVIFTIGGAMSLIVLFVLSQKKSRRRADR